MNEKNNIELMMQDIGAAAKNASEILALSSSDDKNTALLDAAKAIRAAKDNILSANKKDMDIAVGRGLTGAMLDRLMLDEPPRRRA